MIAAGQDRLVDLLNVCTSCIVDTSLVTPITSFVAACSRAIPRILKGSTLSASASALPRLAACVDSIGPDCLTPAVDNKGCGGHRDALFSGGTLVTISQGRFAELMLLQLTRP